MITKAPRFNRHAHQDFSRQLRQRVNQYFEDNNLSRNGDYRIALKSISMFALYFFPYALILILSLNTWQYLIASVIMGVGAAGIGLAIMHDANHGSLSRHSWLNNLLGYSLNIIGGNSLSWRIQHNVLHHSFTNIKGLDEDLEAGNIMRFTPVEPWKPRHRFQHIYGWALYSLMTFSWVVVKDFKKITKYNKEGLLASQNTTLSKALFTIAISKILYLAYIIGVPVMMGYSLWVVLSGFFAMHLVSGLLLAMIFQPAHVMEDNSFTDNHVEELEGCYESHQLNTTINFGAKNALLTWYCGGLNFQVEHHIFPNICHIHYPKIAKIVKETALEYGLSYKSLDTFGEAIALHQRTLKRLSQPEWQLN